MSEPTGSVIWGADGSPAKFLSKVVDAPVYNPDVEAYQRDERIDKALEIPKDAQITFRIRESTLKTGGRPRMIQVSGLRASSKGSAIGAKLLESARSKIKESVGKRLMRRLGMRETDVFAQDIDNVTTIFNDNPEQEFLQILGGPFSRQLYLSAKLDMYAKCFWEQSHMPLFHRACVCLTEYVVGRGVKFKAKDPVFQREWDAYCVRDNFYRRLWWACYDLTWQGEVFWRVFVNTAGDVTVREIDGSTIWEAISEPEDTEIVHGYWQQYPGPYNIYTMLVGGQAVPQTRYLIRILPVDEMIHVRINDTYGEKFGRSDGFSGLGWSKRIRDFGAGVAISVMYENAFAWLVKLKGDSADVSSILNSEAFRKVPKPGSMIVSNDSVEWTPASAKGAGGRGSAKSEVMLDLVRMLGASFGMPIEYLGWIDTGGTKAAAISKTEPFGKHVDTRQFWLETQLLLPFTRKIGEAWVKTGRIPAGTSFDGEWTWPEVEPLDIGQRMNQIAFAQDRRVISEERAATMIATELNITDYDYATERLKVDAELAKRAANGMATMNDRARSVSMARGAMTQGDQARTKDAATNLRPRTDVDGEPDADGGE